MNQEDTTDIGELPEELQNLIAGHLKAIECIILEWEMDYVALHGNEDTYAFKLIVEIDEDE